MREINLTITGSCMTPDNSFAGYAGDHLNTVLRFALPSDWISDKYVYRVLFKPTGCAGFISVSLPLEGNTVKIALPQSVMIYGNLSVQLHVFDADTNKVVHTAISVLTVRASLDSDVPTMDGDNPLINSALMTIEEFASLVENPRADVVTLTAGEDATVDIEIVDGNYVFKFGIPSVGTESIMEHNNDPQAHEALFAANKTEIAAVKEDLQAVKGDIGDIATLSTEAKTVVGAINELHMDVVKLQIESWQDVQDIVRQGLADKVFSVGEQLVCSHETYGELVWDIIGFDCDTPSDSTKTHSMTLQLHDILLNMQVDAAQALYYAETELPAGTYNFTLLAG